MKLSIVELFLLLAHHPSKGRFVINDMLINYGIIAAILGAVIAASVAASAASGH